MLIGISGAGKLNCFVISQFWNKMKLRSLLIWSVLVMRLCGCSHTKRIVMAAGNYIGRLKGICSGAHAFSFRSDIQQFGDIREVDKQIVVDIDLNCGIKRVLDIELAFLKIIDSYGLTPWVNNPILTHALPNRMLILIEVEQRFQIHWHRAVIRIRFHDICHEIPPFPVDRGICTFCPKLFIFNFNITKEGQGLFV